MARLSEPKEQIIKAAAELIQTRGYSAFSYQDLSDKLGIRKASIHHHFATKEDLAHALLTKYRVKFTEWAEKQDSEPSHVKKLENYFFMFTDLSCEGRKICLGGVFCAEWNVISTLVRQGLKELQDAQRQWLTKVILAGRKANEFTKSGAIETQVETIMAAAQGGLQISRVSGENDVIMSIGRNVIKGLLKGKTN